MVVADLNSLTRLFIEEQITGLRANHLATDS